MSTPAKPEPQVDGATLMTLRRRGCSFDAIGAELGLDSKACKAAYIHLIRRDANRARRSQQKPDAQG